MGLLWAWQNFASGDRQCLVTSYTLLLVQVGDTFYILSGGKVRVTRGDTVIRELDTGDYFGEQVRSLDRCVASCITMCMCVTAQALLKTDVRTASVVAVTNVECLTLDRE